MQKKNPSFLFSKAKYLKKQGWVFTENSYFSIICTYSKILFLKHGCVFAEKSLAEEVEEVSPIPFEELDSEPRFEPPSRKEPFEDHPSCAATTPPEPQHDRPFSPEANMPRHRSRHRSNTPEVDYNNGRGQRKEKKSKKSKKSKKDKRRRREPSIYDNGSPVSSDEFDHPRTRRKVDEASPVSSVDEPYYAERHRRPPRTPPEVRPPPLVGYSRTPSPRGGRHPRTPEGPPPPGQGDTPQTPDTGAGTPEYQDTYRRDRRRKRVPATPPEPHPSAAALPLVSDAYADSNSPPGMTQMLSKAYKRPPSPRHGPRTPTDGSPGYRSKRRRTPDLPEMSGYSTPPKRRRSRDRSPPRERKRGGDKYDDRRPAARSPPPPPPSRRRDSRSPGGYRSRRSLSRSPSPRGRYASSRRSSRRSSRERDRPNDRSDLRRDKGRDVERGDSNDRGGGGRSGKKSYAQVSH